MYRLRYIECSGMLYYIMDTRRWHRQQRRAFPLTHGGGNVVIPSVNLPHNIYRSYLLYRPTTPVTQPPLHIDSLILLQKHTSKLSHFNIQIELPVIWTNTSTSLRVVGGSSLFHLIIHEKCEY